LYRHATKQDVGWNYLGVIMSCVAGVTVPLTTIIFGDLIDTFALWQIQRFPGQLITAEELVRRVGDTTLYFVYLASNFY
jgi:hypothetical protein